MDLEEGRKRQSDDLSLQEIKSQTNQAATRIEIPCENFHPQRRHGPSSQIFGISEELIASHLNLVKMDKAVKAPCAVLVCRFIYAKPSHRRLQQIHTSCL
jgi:hypothetical protein